MKRKIFFISIFLFYNMLINAINIRIPYISNYLVVDQYQIGLLKLALEKSGIEYNIIPSRNKFSQTRIISELEKKDGIIDLYWMGTSKELEEKLLPIRIPLFRGLLGYRLFIINKNQQHKFNNVKTLKDLQNFRGQQGRGWSDIEILEYSGLKQGTSQYETIFRMVDSGVRVDYFSRGITQIFGEVEARKSILPNLSVEKNILLVYPFAMFFFVNRSNEELAKAIQLGLERAYQDGSFIEYFNNSPSIKKVFNLSDIKNRIRIDIPNPLMTPKTLSIPDKYWYK